MSKLIVGLGNPGFNYEKTRHNAGFIAIDLLLIKYGFSAQKEMFKGLLYISNINNEKVYFLKPQTYMNLSGECIFKVMEYFKISIQDTIIIYDDKDLNLSQIKFKDNGSAGGHNGIKNIIHHFKTQNFNRLKIGIGNPKENYKIIDWVLSKFTDAELELLTSKIKLISDFVLLFVLNSDIKKIQQIYNE